MQAHELKFYAAIGDHEIGDNPWIDSAKVAVIPAYKEALLPISRCPKMALAICGEQPTGGVIKMSCLYRWMFLKKAKVMKAASNPGCPESSWPGWRVLLLENRDARHKIIVGYTPVLGPVRRWSTSGLKVAEGRQSGFWQTMSKHDRPVPVWGDACHYLHQPRWCDAGGTWRPHRV